MSKKIPDDEFQQQKRFYEGILEDIKPEFQNVRDTVEELERKNKNAVFMNFRTVKEISDAKAKKTINDFINFFIPDEDLKKSDFLRSKVELDIFVLSKVIFQTEACEFAIMKIVELIDEGEINSRNIEAMAELQKSSMEIIKFLVQLQNVMELTYKNYYDTFLIAKAEREIELKRQSNKQLDSNGIQSQVQGDVKRMKFSKLLDEVKTTSEGVEIVCQ